MAKKFFVSVCIFVLLPVFLFCACVAPGISGSGTHGADCTCEQCKPGGDAHGADCTCEACNPGDSKHPADCTCEECNPGASHGVDCDCAECKKGESEMPEENYDDNKVWALDSRNAKKEEVLPFPISSPPSIPLWVAYRADKTEFDINDVTLTFFYGNGFGMRPEYSGYDVYLSFGSFQDERIYDNDLLGDRKSVGAKVVKTIPGEDFFNSERYLSTKHSEKFTIPKELFPCEKGIITFGMWSTLIEVINFSNGFNRPIDIFYQRVGNKITLSVDPVLKPPPPNPYACAVDIDKEEYDLDDVTLTFYYGHKLDDKAMAEYFEYLYHRDLRTVVFTLSFISDGGGSSSNSSQNFKIIPCEEVYTGRYLITINPETGEPVFTYSEIIAIPKKAFYKEAGYVQFNFSEQRVYDQNNYVTSGSSALSSSGIIRIYYKVIGEKVILSDTEFSQKSL